MMNYKLIANPAAGRGKARKAVLKVVEVLKKKGVLFDLELTKGPRDAAAIARRAAPDFDAIIVVGGDGTVNDVVPGMLYSGKPLGIIPMGSGNDFIKSLHIPNNIESAVDVVLRGATRTIDAGRINDMYFANGVGIGFDAAVNAESYRINHSRHGLWLYVCALARVLGRFDPVPVTITLNNEEISQKIFLLSIGNGTTCGGGFKLTPHAKVDDGLLDVTIVGPLGLLALLWHLPKVFLGTIDRVKYAKLRRTSKLMVRSEVPVPVHVDGEIFTSPDNRYEIEVVPRALIVIGNL
ncbi:MAG: diacylglycerol kinase family lipid kinase [Nitrospirae bacterium]|nr:diacylglycerol kinase family lipid kinase [Nitrospirota bacterium]